jgi:hypothetical protein
MTSVRRALDRIAAGALGPALTRPVAVSLRRDALAALHDERPADEVLERALARLEVAGAGTAEMPSAGRVGTRVGTAPSGWWPGQPPAPSPQAARARHQVVEESQEAAPTISGGSRPQLTAAALRPALRFGRAPGPAIVGNDRHHAPMTVIAGATNHVLAKHTTAREVGIAEPMRSAARRSVVAPAAVLGRDALERLVRPPAVVALDGSDAPAKSASPTHTHTLSSVPTEPTATARPVPRPASLADRRRRPSRLAELAEMYSSADPADHTAAGAREDARWSDVDPPDARGELAITGRDGAALPPADGGRLLDPRSRLSPSPAAELSGVAAVLEAVLLHEARRYGVSVEET